MALFFRQVRIAIRLIRTGVQPKDIAILTPYNAQVVNISETLRRDGVGDVTVNTIMKSQGKTGASALGS